MIADKITSATMRQAMTKRWSAPEYAIMWEVGRATGAVGSQRYADAVMMSLWPSRGLELHGVEIKVNRYDWMRESKDPTKAEAIAAYCDRWWIHVAPGVIGDPSELPPAWGAREFNGKTWRTIKEAERTDAKPCDRAFLASLLRRADELGRGQVQEEARAIAAAAVANAEAHIKSEIERRSRDVRGAEEKVRAFEQASGLSMNDYMMGGAKEIGTMVRLIHAAGLSPNSYHGVTQILSAARRTVSDIEAAIERAGLKLPEGDASK